MPLRAWRLPRLVYNHLPPSQRHLDLYARRGLEPDAFPTCNHYQVMPISEILFCQMVFPAAICLSNIDDPQEFLLCEDGSGIKFPLGRA